MYVHGRTLSTKSTLGSMDARDTLDQVRRGRGFWPVNAIPAPDGRSATLAVRSGGDTFRGGKGKENRGTTHKGKNKGGKGGRSSESSKGGKSEVPARAPEVRVTL